MNEKRKAETDSIEESALPLVITSIKPQKKNRDRFSLFHEETFLIGLSGETLLDLGLTTGTLLDRKLLSAIQSEEQKLGLKSYLLRLLGRRDHPRKELETKAVKKGYLLTDISPALDALEAKGYINDEVFAERFISDKISLGKWGPKKIEAELIKKGVGHRTISRAFQERSGDLQLQQICVDLAVSRRKRFLRESDSYKRKRKIVSFLQQRGFGYDAINQALPEILHNLNS